MSRKILLLSAYDAISHQQWQSALAAMAPDWHWTRLSLPARHFSWRVRGNALTWGARNYPALNDRYDLLIATSMVDLASLRGFRPGLAQLPTLYYFHENQFVYPAGTDHSGFGEATRLDATLVSLYGALCADRVVFNSAYNRNSWLAGLEKLLDRLPDQVPDGILQRLGRSSVLPVPLITDPPPDASRPATDTRVLTVAWNHRWEYDKGPELLLRIVEAVFERHLRIRFCIMGQQFRTRPAEFDLIERRLRAHGEATGLRHHLGQIDSRQEYLAALRACDVVLSTADHDFQGLSILEGAALGCTPLCPDQVVYPEYLPPEFLYARQGKTSIKAANGALDRLLQWSALKAGGSALPQFNTGRFSLPVLKQSYLALFEEMIAAGSAG